MQNEAKHPASRLRVRSDHVMTHFAWLAAGVVLAVALAVVDTLPVGVARDDGWYVILAKSLATGQGYRWISLPDAPAATLLPPGYPAVLALFWWLVPSFPANVLLFKALNACFLAAAAGTLAVLAHQRLGFGRAASLLLAVVACAGIPTLVLSTMLMSEPLFLAMALPTLLAAERIVAGERRTSRLIAVGALAGAATLVRSLGIALVIAIVGMLLVRRRYRAAWPVALGALVLVLPWQLWVRAHEGVVPASMRGSYESYTSWFAEGLRSEGLSLITQTLARTTGEITAMFATLGAPSWPAPVRVAVLIVLAALIAVGAKRFWRSAPVTLLFIALYVVIVVLWPFNPARFIWGIWPIVVLLVATGAREIVQWPAPLQVAARSAWSARATRVARYALIAGVVVLAVGYLRYTARGYRGRWWSSIAQQRTRSAQPLVVWARTRTRPDEVIASAMEPMLYLYSGRRGVAVTSFTHHSYFRPATVSESEAVLRDILSSYRVDAVAVVENDSLGAAALAMAARKPPELVLRDSLANGLIFTPMRP
jgi:hypothetical protein